MLYNTLTLLDIAIIRNHFHLVEGLGVTLFPGAILRVIGTNGAGKTSLLRIIAGLADANAGQVICNQVDIRLEIHTYYSMVNYIGHLDAINNELTTLENITFWTTIYNSIETLDAAISHMELQNYLDIPAGKLSKGLRKRVALTKLLISHKCFWILDEPFANLDALSTERLCNMIAAKSSQGGIIIISSHKEQDALSESNVINNHHVSNLFLAQFTH